MKPKIKKENGKWKLTYKFPPREFWLFGADAARRKEISDLCVQTVEYTRLESCFLVLKWAYENRQVVRD